VPDGAAQRRRREHAGTLHRVVVLEDGFAWNGTTYRSLSEVARAITGTNWNGPRFFGLKHVAGRGYKVHLAALLITTELLIMKKLILPAMALAAKSCLDRASWTVPVADVKLTFAKSAQRAGQTAVLHLFRPLT
jgi:hypothetical protein